MYVYMYVWLYNQDLLVPVSKVNSQEDFNSYSYYVNSIIPNSQSVYFFFSVLVYGRVEGGR